MFVETLYPMKIKFIRSLFVIIAIMSFQSCENESLDSDFTENANDGTDGQGTNNGGTDSDVGESSGDYWPRAIGNIWNFSDTFYGDTTYNMISTETIDDNLYYKFDQLMNQESWLRKTGDSYYIRAAVQSFPIEGYEVATTYLTIKMLKDSAQIGETWTNNVNYTITYVPITDGLPEIPAINIDAVYDLEMMGRDLTRTVGDVTFENVLHVELNLSSGQVSSAVDYYYAKDVGLIEFVGDQSSGALLSYTLN
jgi:hypothetical protein